jgi:hypothetical protein
MIVQVSSNLHPTFDGQLIETATTVPELHAFFGRPSRIAHPPKPPPVGHRHNQIHIYDQHGIAFYEHHYTRRISNAEILFTPKGEMSCSVSTLHIIAES